MFQEDEGVLSDGYWAEFFLLKPDKLSLQRRLEALSADDLLHFQVCELNVWPWTTLTVIA